MIKFSQCNFCKEIINTEDWILQPGGINECREQSVPVFMKDSLIDIVSEKQLVREFPWQRGEIKDK